MINELIADANQRMDKTLKALADTLDTVRTGRANISLLDQITVDYYGSAVPINQVANVSVSDARTLLVTAWEKDMVPKIEKAIMNSALGLNPMTAGTSMRLPLPPLTEERRKDLIRVVRGHAEASKVAIRNVRRDANQDFKDLLKDKDISLDDERRAQTRVQTITDEHVAEIDKILHAKEQELMAV